MKTSIIAAATALLVSNTIGTAIPDLFPRSNFHVGCTGDHFSSSPVGKCATVNADNCKTYCKCDKNSMKCDNKYFGKCSKNDMKDICLKGFEGGHWKCYCEPN